MKLKSMVDAYNKGKAQFKKKKNLLKDKKDANTRRTVR